MDERRPARDDPPSAGGAETRLQSLWTGYGEIVRRRCDDDDPHRSVVVKRVRPPTAADHPRGFGGARSHARKLRSYAVEAAVYRHDAPRCDVGCRVAQAYRVEGDDDGWSFELEDLDASGFPRRRLDREGMTAERDLAAVVGWLARFHARFLYERPSGLWPRGTYWHLATRPDEWAAMRDITLKGAAAALDARLDSATPRTLVHGDAKLANFCFAVDGTSVAAVDFQYVGGGVGTQDLVYFLGSALDERGLFAAAERWTDEYFAALRRHTAEIHPEANLDALERSWRSLIPVAWADFERFLDGWSPDHWKRSRYARDQLRRALAEVEVTPR
ncbi:MAG: phosphotransferase [Myxococcota bacterium]